MSDVMIIFETVDRKHTYTKVMPQDQAVRSLQTINVNNIQSAGEESDVLKRLNVGVRTVSTRLPPSRPGTIRKFICSTCLSTRESPQWLLLPFCPRILGRWQGPSNDILSVSE